jgi:hypothetical protein
MVPTAGDIDQVTEVESVVNCWDWDALIEMLDGVMVEGSARLMVIELPVAVTGIGSAVPEDEPGS